MIGHHIGPQTRALEPEHIGHRRLKIGPIKSEISLPRLDVLPDGAVPQPQASLLPQSQGISSLHLTSLLHIQVIAYWVNGFLSTLCLSHTLFI